MLRTVELERRGVVVPSGDIGESRRAWGVIRQRHGLRPDNGSSLLTMPSAQPKVGKNFRPTVSVTLLAGSESGLCVNDSACFHDCVVNQSMRAQYRNVIAARNAGRTSSPTTRNCFWGCC